MCGSDIRTDQWSVHNGVDGYRRFLRAMFRIGCVGFGGGSALIPVIERELVDRQGLDQKERIDRDAVVASVTPGALPVEIAAAVGRRGFGAKGMVGGAVMMALPGAMLAILLVTFLSVFQERIFLLVNVISIAASVYIIRLLLSCLRGIMEEYGADSKKRKYQTLLLMTGVCVLSFWFSTIAVLVMAFAGVFLISGCRSRGSSVQTVGVKRGGNRRAIRKDVCVWAVFLLLLTMPAMLANPQAAEFFGKGILSVWTSFGGGDAYLTIAEGFFVESQAVSAHQYYSCIVPAVNILPGSILCKTLSAVGYYVGWNLSGSVAEGLLFAMGGFGCSIAASCALFIVVWHLYDYLDGLRFFQVVRRWIRPMIGGLLIKVMIKLISQNLTLIQSFF